MPGYWGLLGAGPSLPLPLSFICKKKCLSQFTVSRAHRRHTVGLPGRLLRPVCPKFIDKILLLKDVFAVAAS